MKISKAHLARSLGLSLLISAYVSPLATAQDSPELLITLTMPNTSDQDIAELGSTLQAAPISMVFASFDSNFDKLVSPTELRAGIEREWTSMNPSFRGNVGAINFEDWMVSALGASDAYPTRLSFDADLNGQISKSEFITRLTTSFKGLDSNDDSALSRKELTFRVAKRGETVERTRIRPAIGSRDANQ